MRSISDIVAGMRAHLQVVEPDLDTSAGSVVRKMLDAVGEAIAETEADSHLLDYRYDIDAKFGDDLDDFVRLFGMSRHPAQRATGEVVFERSSAAEADIFIPVGTQVADQSYPPSLVATTVPASLRAGDTSVSVPVRALEGGSEGNLAAGTASRKVTPLNGVSGVTNPTALTGGRNEEDDESLRERFKETVFRSLAGTHQMYLAVALEDEDVSQANVLGASRRFRERIEVDAGEATSTVEGASYIYPDSATLGPDIDVGDILIPGVHYEFDDTQNPPVITVLDDEVMPDGLYDLEFEFEPVASRNDVQNGVTNRVDVYLNGQRAVEAMETLAFRGKQFVDDPGDPLHYENFERRDGSHPVVGSYFIRYGFAPVIDPSLDDNLIIDGQSYEEDEDYFLVNDITNQGGGPRSLSGVEMLEGVSPVPPLNTTFTANYAYNAIPRSVSADIERWRLLTTGVLVHQARVLRLRAHFAIMYERGFSASGVNEEVFASLQRFLDRLGFVEVVQTSDILREASRVEGVDAIRFLTETDDDTVYAIQQVAEDGETILRTFADASGRAVDVFSSDDELPILDQVTFDARGPNTFAEGQ